MSEENIPDPVIEDGLSSVSRMEMALIRMDQYRKYLILSLLSFIGFLLLGGFLWVVSGESWFFNKIAGICLCLSIFAMVTSVVLGIVICILSIKEEEDIGI